jgi:hypothetical protein
MRLAVYLREEVFSFWRTRRIRVARRCCCLLVRNGKSITLAIEPPWTTGGASKRLPCGLGRSRPQRHVVRRDICEVLDSSGPVALSWHPVCTYPFSYSLQPLEGPVLDEFLTSIAKTGSSGEVTTKIVSATRTSTVLLPRPPRHLQDSVCTPPCTKRSHMISTNTLCRKHSLTWILVAFLLWITAQSISAQVVPALHRNPYVSIFSTFTTAKPDFNHYKDYAVYGFSLGGFVQTHHVIGAEVRGSILRWGGGGHQGTALAGPRAALHFGRISPYASVLVGAALAWWYSNQPGEGLPIPRAIEGVGFLWALLGGVDVRVNRSISLRVGELGYSKIYEKGKTLTPLYASAGVVYTFN